MLNLICGNKIITVENVIVKWIGDNEVIFVNNGHDDLFDIGFRHIELVEHGLKIERTSDVN